MLCGGQGFFVEYAPGAPAGQADCYEQIELQLGRPWGLSAIIDSNENCKR